MLSFQTFLYLGLTFFIGALIGYLLCFFSNRNKDKSRMEDELTKAKRELYTPISSILQTLCLNSQKVVTKRTVAI